MKTEKFISCHRPHNLLRQLPETSPPPPPCRSSDPNDDDDCDFAQLSRFPLTLSSFFFCCCCGMRCDGDVWFSININNNNFMERGKASETYAYAVGWFVVVAPLIEVEEECWVTLLWVGRMGTHGSVCVCGQQKKRHTYRVCTLSHRHSSGLW